MASTCMLQSWGQPCGPHLGDQRDYHAVALDHRPQCPGGCSDAGSARGGPDLAPTPPFSFLPLVAYRDQCQLCPTALHDWLQEQASIPAQVGHEARWGGQLRAAGRSPSRLDQQGPTEPYIGAPHGQRPNDDAPGTQIVPPCHGAGHHVPSVWNTAGNGAPPVGLLGPIP